GVMGGKDSEISDATTTVLLESAQFDPASIRSTARALAMSTDASYRFERGVDPVGVEWASRRCAHLIAKLCGGQVAPGVVDVWAAPWRPRKVTLRVSRMNQLLGMEIGPGRAVDVLRNLGVPARRAGEDLIETEPPSFRPDIEREVDLIEEVARIEGLDKVPETTTLRVTAGRKSAAERAFDLAAAVLVGAGHSEVLTISFQDEASSRMASPWTNAAPLTFNNVVRREENRLRVSLLAEMLRVRRLNASRGADDVRIFEISKVYLPRPSEKLPEERAVLALLRDDDILSVKGLVEALLGALRVTAKVEWRRLQDGFFDPAMAAEALLDGRRLAVIGQVSAQAAAAFDLKRRPFAAEVDFDLLTSAACFDARHAPLPAFPASERDLAVIVDEAVAWADIEATVRGQKTPVLESVRFFDIYRGKQIAQGKKSVAFRMVFRAPDRTLTGEEVDGHCQAIVKALAAGLKAELRA
ncbi:MAG TPA: phenylalanine--tRNA ligase subunit beta, partial [Candidatus Brocadiia bacterium]|nr:phenylalanine--tRNA ligase subunit beta [Candidatus Brocadiia bacterium]